MSSIGRYETGCPMPGLSGEAVRMPDAARDRFAEGVEVFIAALEKVFVQLGRHEPHVLATSVVSELVGTVALARILDRARATDMLESAAISIKRRLSLSDAPTKA